MQPWKLLPSFLLATGCTSSLARPPQIPENADLPTREAIYKRYHLVQTTTGASINFRRGNAEYSFGEMQAVAETYPESADKFHASQLRATGLATMAGLGAFIIGFTVGWAIKAPPSKQLSTATQVALYSSGGALLLTPLVIVAATHDPGDDVADAYNERLRRELSLPAQRAAIGHAWTF
jgi:hypothetical protein